MAIKVYVTGLPGLPEIASCVSRPAVPPLVLTSCKPGNKIEVFPAAAGRPFVSVTVNGVFSVTINVGPGTCIALQKAATFRTGAKPPGAPLQPYPHE